jgi:hypothetical protein
MNVFMSLKLTVSVITFATVITLESKFMDVSLLMYLQVSFVYGCIATYVTDMVPFPRVYLFVSCQFI